MCFDLVDRSFRHQIAWKHSARCSAEQVQRPRGEANLHRPWAGSRRRWSAQRLIKQTHLPCNILTLLFIFNGEGRLRLRNLSLELGTITRTGTTRKAEMRVITSVQRHWWQAEKQRISFGSPTSSPGCRTARQRSFTSSFHENWGRQTTPEQVA